MNITSERARLNSASTRVAAAKAAFTAAAQAAISGDPNAERMSMDALAELYAARADLLRLHGAPVPQGMWAESARIMRRL